MAKRGLVQDQDKFIVRLPEGMRERIKAGAARAGISMNEAIVWCLEQHFPAPATLEQKVHELSKMVALLKHGSGAEEAIDGIIGEIESILRDVADEKVKSDAAFSTKVAEKIYEWDMDAAEQSSDPFDDQNWGSGSRPGRSPDAPRDPDWDPFEVDKGPKS